MIERVVPAVLALCLLGCGASRHGPKPVANISLERLYPLRLGSVWTYDVDTGQGMPILAITRVTAHDGVRVELSSGSDPIRYELSAEGIFRTDRRGFLLKPPFTEGASWDAGGGATAEVSATGRIVETLAGSFTDCIEVSERGAATGGYVRTVYCPDVGPVEIESSVLMDESGQRARVISRLRGYDFSGAGEAP